MDGIHRLAHRLKNGHDRNLGRPEHGRLYEILSQPLDAVSDMRGSCPKRYRPPLSLLPGPPRRFLLDNTLDLPQVFETELAHLDEMRQQRPRRAPEHFE